jgi:hypothetical protein
MCIQQMASLSGLLQALPDLSKYQGWLKSQDQFPTSGKRDMPCQAKQNLGEL